MKQNEIESETESNASTMFHSNSQVRAESFSIS